MKNKEFNKLTLQVLILGAMMIVFSFITDTKWWLDMATYDCIQEGKWSCNRGFTSHRGESYHWNFRGYIWLLTGLALTIISIVRIILNYNK